MLFTHTFQFHQLIYEYINWIYQLNQPKCISFQIKQSISIAWSLIYILPCVWLFDLHTFGFWFSHHCLILPPRSACATVGSAISFLTFWKRYILFLDFGSRVNGKISTPARTREIYCLNCGPGAWNDLGYIFLLRKHFLMRRHDSLWGSTFLHEEARFLMRKHVSSWESKFHMRKYVSSWGSTFPHEEESFLMRKDASSWGKVLPSKETCFLLRNVHRCEEASFLVRKHVLIRKHNSAWGSILSHEEAGFIMRKHISSWGRMFPPEEACFLLGPKLKL